MLCIYLKKFTLVKVGQQLVSTHLHETHDKNEKEKIYLSPFARAKYQISIIVANGNPILLHKHAITSLCYLYQRPVFLVTMVCLTVAEFLLMCLAFGSYYLFI